MRVPAAGEDARFTVYGALDYASGQVTWQTAPRKDAATFVAFLAHLEATLPAGQILVVLDNVGYHKGHLARRWRAAHHDRIRPLWLPAYSPHLNLIERVWRHLKDKLANHRWWADLPALEHATGVLLDHLRAHFHRPDQGIRLVRNFHKSAYARIASGASDQRIPHRRTSAWTARVSWPQSRRERHHAGA